MHMGSKSPELKEVPKTDPINTTLNMNIDSPDPDRESSNPERESSNPKFPTPDSSNLGGGADQGAGAGAGAGAEAGAGAGAGSGSGIGAEDLATTQLEKRFKIQRSVIDYLGDKHKAQVLAY